MFTIRKGWTGVILILLLVGSDPVLAQFSVTSTDPSDGAYGIPDTARVTFHFSRPLPFSTNFLSGFRFAEPARDLSVRAALLDLDGRGQPSIVRLTIAHRRATDFVWVVYGLQSGGGAHLSNPYVLNYSTRSDVGTRLFSGQLVSGSSSNEVPTLTMDLAKMIAAGSYGRVIEDDLVRHAMESPEMKEAHVGSRPSMAKFGEHIHPERTIVLLLEQHSIDAQNWRVVAGGQVDPADSSFRLKTVRAGTFYPLAITFREQDTGFIEAFGFYDANGDHAPDSIDFSEGDVEDISLSMYDFRPMAALDNMQRAGDAARSVQDDNTMIAASASVVAADGTALSWSYDFISPAGNRLTTVVLDPIAARIEERAAPSEFARMEPIDAVQIDSPEALGIADAAGGDAFSAAADGPVTRSLALSDAQESYRPEQPGAFWAVKYSATFAGQDSSLVVFVDPMTGQVLEDRHVVGVESTPSLSSFTVASPYPNPFSDALNIPFRLSRPADVEVEIYDALGRLVFSSARLSYAAGRHEYMWEGGDVAPGLYLIRLRDSRGATSVTRAIRTSER